jgi:tRNA (guanine-N7-)-methyltransferase
MKLKARTKNRLRHHTNPLNFRAEDLVIPDWQELLGGQPQEVDIGIGLGDFLAAYAQLNPETRIAGIEVRAAFCDEARIRLAQAGVRNAAVIHADATRFLATILAPDSIRCAFISFPDPWFKKRHHKRRLIGAGFLEQLHKVLIDDGIICLQSDAYDLAQDMTAAIDASGLFINTAGPGKTWEERFCEASTEREEYYRARSLPVWRYRYAKAPKTEKRDG